MRTRLVLAVAPLALVAVATLPSSAAPKPMKGAYTAAAPVPGGAADDCEGAVPGSLHTETIKVPAAGRFTADLTGFQGDWDFFLKANGGLLSSSTGSVDAPKETVSAKIKKAGSVQLISCNWAGGPSAAVSWTFLPNK